MRRDQLRVGLSILALLLAAGTVVPLTNESRASGTQAQPPVSPRRPATGTILYRVGGDRGYAELAVSNRLGVDTVVGLHTASALYLTIYVRARETAVVSDIAAGSYHVRYETGEGWMGDTFAKRSGSFQLKRAIVLEESHRFVHGSGGTTRQPVPGDRTTIILGGQK